MHINKEFTQMTGGSLLEHDNILCRGASVNRSKIKPDRIYDVEVITHDEKVVNYNILNKIEKVVKTVTPITFKLSEQETINAKEWMAEHSKMCKVRPEQLPAAGEHYYFKIIPTGLGPCTSVGCIYCKTQQDITDYGNW